MFNKCSLTLTIQPEYKILNKRKSKFIKRIEKLVVKEMQNNLKESLPKLSHEVKSFMEEVLRKHLRVSACRIRIRHLLKKTSTIIF